MVPAPRHPIYPIHVTRSGDIIGPSGRRLSPFPDKKGYPSVTVRLNGKTQRRPVHVLVCETFHGPRPEGHHAAHLNGIKTDCRPENLEWKTPKGNSEDTLRHGTSPRGERNPKAKLDAVDIQAIRSSSESSSELAFIFGVTSSTIRSIRNRRIWSHVA